MVGNILAVGLMSLGMGMQGVKDEPKKVIDDPATYTMTYTKAEFDEIAVSLSQWLTDNGYQGTLMPNNPLDITGKLIYQNETEWQLLQIASYISNDDNGLKFTNTEYDTMYYNNGNFKKNGTTQQIATITITSETLYNEVLNPPEPMGEQIITAIASGLGLIGALATEFLAGFGALFYVQGALTTFAIFSLVMLGVAVSFAVVKLVLNLIRSNTGA